MQPYYNRPINWLPFVAAIALSFFNVFSFAETDSYQINWNQSRLSISANNAPLAKLLTQLATQTGVEVRGLLSIQDTANVNFSNLSLREGLQKLLVGKNYFIVDKESADGTVVPGIVLILDSGPRSTIQTATREAPMEIDNGISEVPARLSRLEQAIGANAPDLRENLYAATRDSEPLIRELAYRELHRRDDATVLDVLRRDARSEDIDVRRTALDILPQLDQENAIEILAEAASDSSMEIRQKAFENLLKIEPGPAIIKKKLHDPDPDVRIAAIEALASRGKDSAREAATATLHDVDGAVRAKAAAISLELQAVR